MNEVWSGILSGVGLAFVLLVMNVAYSHYQWVKVVSFIRNRLFFYFNEADEDTLGKGGFFRLACFEAFVRELNVIIETRGKNLKDDELCGLLRLIRYFEAYLENRKHHVVLNDLRLEEYKEMFLPFEESEGTKFLNFATKPVENSIAIPTINGNVFANDR